MEITGQASGSGLDKSAPIPGKQNIRPGRLLLNNRFFLIYEIFIYQESKLGFPWYMTLSGLLRHANDRYFSSKGNTSPTKHSNRKKNPRQNNSFKRRFCRGEQQIYSVFYRNRCLAYGHHGPIRQNNAVPSRCPRFRHKNRRALWDGQLRSVF